MMLLPVFDDCASKKIGQFQGKAELNLIRKFPLNRVILQSQKNITTIADNQHRMAPVRICLCLLSWRIEADDFFRISE
jgi:hypothetical protein